jgi:hypothetical protein
MPSPVGATPIAPFPAPFLDPPKFLSSPSQKNNPQLPHSKRKKLPPNLQTISRQSAHWVCASNQAGFGSPGENTHPPSPPPEFAVLRKNFACSRRRNTDLIDPPPGSDDRCPEPALSWPLTPLLSGFCK